VPLRVTSRAIEVFRRALDVGRMDPARIGIRVSIARGLKGEEVRTGFAEQPEPDEVILEVDEVRLFLAAAMAGRDGTIDVADEHDRIVLL
jgi:Fe-S cluster assembly iron-binding protein IscA